MRRFLPMILGALVSLVGGLGGWPPVAWAQQAFTTFESGQVRPLALSPDGSRLFAVNTPDARLEIFRIGPGGIAREASVPVGLEPVAVAARSATEVWVVNHLSDSISIVSLASSPPRVVRTLQVGDEPRDIVFAGPLVSGSRSRAFITAAHRGHGRPNQANPPLVNPQLSTPGVGRADVWVFDANNLGSTLEGTPLTRLTLFADTPRALAVSADGNTVFAAAFHSGNKTTSVTEAAVCNDANLGDLVVPGSCSVNGISMPGGLPLPSRDKFSQGRPEVGLIVKHDGTAWRDELGRSWNNAVKFNLPDTDVFAISAATNPPAQTQSWSGVGTVLFNMVVGPTGKVYVSNTEAQNQVRFEGPGPTDLAFPTTTVQGHLHEARITVLSGASVLPRHLNKHINYAQLPAPGGVKNDSLATPTALALNGSTLYVAAFSSSKIGIFDTTALENDTFTPSALDHISITGGGPSGLALNATGTRLYVLTRFDNAVSAVDLATRTEIVHTPLHNPEPAAVVAGRPVLYDAMLSSSNGEASCSSCHIFGDFDSLGWDLGNPHDPILNNPNLFRVGPFPNEPAVYSDFHGMKGPMTTQTLRGMANMGPMHWRGDRTGGNDPGGSSFDENAAFNKFIGAFNGLLGKDTALSPGTMQQFTDFILQVTLPPNPVRALDGSLTAQEQAGRNRYFGAVSDGIGNCNFCHVLDPSIGAFGADGRSSFEGETQHFKIAHTRNAYAKVGMFGFPNLGGGIRSTPAGVGDQVRGFGFLHDGSIPNVATFLSSTVFTLSTQEEDDIEAFIYAFDTNLAPIVGQQVTLTSTNAAVAGPRVSLLIARANTSWPMVNTTGGLVANARECELVVKGNVLTGADVGARGWVRLSNGTFRSDRNTTYADTALRNLAKTAGQELTYTCVPPGFTATASGQRAGIDRDEDGLLDGLDNCSEVSNSGQQDTDADARGNVCDNCVAKANASQSDLDADGTGDLCDNQCVGGLTTTLASFQPVSAKAGVSVEVIGTAISPSARLDLGGSQVPITFTAGAYRATVPTVLPGVKSATIVNPEGCQSQETVSFTVNETPISFPSCGLLGPEPLLVVGALRLLQRRRRDHAPRRA